LPKSEKKKNRQGGGGGEGHLKHWHHYRKLGDKRENSDGIREKPQGKLVLNGGGGPQTSQDWEASGSRVAGREARSQTPKNQLNKKTKKRLLKKRGQREKGYGLLSQGLVGTNRTKETVESIAGIQRVAPTAEQEKKKKSRRGWKGQ